MKNSYILCIESSGTNCSVAIAQNNKILANQSENTGIFIHAEKLHLFIEKALTSAQLSYTNLSAIAVSSGPGSYTGLRIGVASAKGICFALNIPLIAIPTLTLLALQAQTEIIIPMLDARRMEVYSAVYNRSYQLLEKTQAIVLNQNSYEKWFQQNKQITFIGDGVEKYRSICPYPQAFFHTKAYPQASDMVSLAYDAFQQKNFVNTAYFEPNYLKPFQSTL